MALNDMTIRNAKHGKKPIKLFDERGLFLLLQPSGGKLSSSCPRAIPANRSGT